MALLTVHPVQSIILNRTNFYASSRQNLVLQWRSRLLLYAVPIVLLLTQTLWMLRAMRCQTSPNYPLLRYGNPNKNLAINFGGDGGFMYTLSSLPLFWETDSASCSAMGMSLQNDDKLNVMGSFSLIWPFFIILCISQFVETLACALQGRQPMPETGMTTFEHSLAFAECEAMISNALGLGIFNTGKHDRGSERGSSSGDSILMTRSMILRRLNVPSEVLLISLISCLSHLSSVTLAVTGHRQKFRLVNTGIWALCYMAAFVWSFVRVIKEPLGAGSDLGILRFPTTCVIGHIPHILTLIGIIFCSIIYGFALLVTATSLPPGSPPNLSVKQRFAAAFHNLQANVQFSSSSSTIRLDWQEDFYTTLLKVGFNVLTAASEAVYLNEGSAIAVREMTWLEDKRIRELSSHSNSTTHIPLDLLGEGIARGVEFTDDSPPRSNSSSGYARERRSRTAKGAEASQVGALDSGLGLADRRSRWQMLLEFINGIARLLVSILARATLRIGERSGVQWRPRWLLRYANATNQPKRTALGDDNARHRSRNFWLISEDGTLALPKSSNVDVEHETRQRLRRFNPITDEALDDNLYGWWKTGGWWGEVDSSGEYKAADQDDDVTSMISMSTNASQAESDASAETSGRRTPTQEDPFPRDSSAERPFGISDLARLLDPRTPEDREEAQMLSRHLQSERPVTRAQYRRSLNTDKARILTLRRPYHSGSTQRTSASAELDEENALEHFVLERRATAQRQAADDADGSWSTGAQGMGAGGPQCVVCQSSPRVILVWPCGCLSICDDCRVGVAARNFANCLCCRTNVVAYSRLYVP